MIRKTTINKWIQRGREREREREKAEEIIMVRHQTKVRIKQLPPRLYTPVVLCVVVSGRQWSLVCSTSLLNTRLTYNLHGGPLRFVVAVPLLMKSICLHIDCSIHCIRSRLIAL